MIWRVAIISTLYICSAVLSRRVLLFGCLYLCSVSVCSFHRRTDHSFPKAKRVSSPTFKRHIKLIDAVHLLAEKVMFSNEEDFSYIWSKISDYFPCWWGREFSRSNIFITVRVDTCVGWATSGKALIVLPRKLFMLKIEKTSFGDNIWGAGEIVNWYLYKYVYKSVV